MVRSMSSTDNYVQMMKDSLIMKKNVLEKAIVLNDEQKSILMADSFDGDAFQNNVSRKSELAEEINRLDNGFDELFRRVKETIEVDKKAYSRQIAEMKALITDVTDLLVKVETGEKRNKELADKRFADLRRDVQKAKRNTNLTNTYYQNMNMVETEPQFMDQKK